MFDYNTQESLVLLHNSKLMTETTETQTTETNVNPESTKPKDSYVKLAMRNMVRKGGTSIKHFLLTTLGILGLLIGLAYLTKP